MSLLRFVGRRLRLARRTAAAIIALCALATAAPSWAAPRILRFAYILPATSQLGAGAAAFASTLERRSGGRFSVEQYPNAMLGGEVAVLEAVKADAIDLAFVTGAPLPNAVPAVGIFDMPFLFRDAGEARRVLDGPIGADYLGKFDAAGLHALAWGENGLRHLTTGDRAVRSPADLVGLILRLPQSDVMRDGFQALGVEVRPIPFPQVYSALRTGVVEGQENPIATIVSSRFYEVQHHLALTGHIYDPAVMLVSPGLWAALSAGDRADFAAAARAAADASRAYVDGAERPGLATIRAAGVEVVEGIDRAAFAAAAGAAEPLYAKRYGREAIERIRRDIAGQSAEPAAGPAAEPAAGQEAPR